MTEQDILKDIQDFEEMPNGKMLILKKNGQRVLIECGTEKFKEKCYEVMGKLLKIEIRKNKIKKIYWSDEEKEFLKNNSNLEIKELSEILKKSYYQINYMKGKLNLIDKKNWTDVELEYLEKNINKNNTILAEELNRTIFSVKSKKHVLRNKKAYE